MLVCIAYSFHQIFANLLKYLISIYNPALALKVAQLQIESFRLVHILQMVLQNLVGVLISYWMFQDRIMSNQGTAVAIAPQIIMSCTHNIWNEEWGQCDLAQFIPNITYARFGEVQKIYGCRPSSTFKYSHLPSWFRHYPAKEEVAFIPLEQKMKISQFAKFGRILPHQVQQELTLVGYPANQQQNLARQNKNLVFKRHISKGRLYQPVAWNQTVAKYTMETSIGCSGGPAFMKDEEGSYKIVLMHTHGGNNNGQFNVGVCFNGGIGVSMDKSLREIQNENNFERKEYMHQQLREIIDLHNFWKQVQEIHAENQIGTSENQDQQGSISCQDKRYEGLSQSDFDQEQNKGEQPQILQQGVQNINKSYSAYSQFSMNEQEEWDVGFQGEANQRERVPPSEQEDKFITEIVYLSTQNTNCNPSPIPSPSKTQFSLGQHRRTMS